MINGFGVWLIVSFEIRVKWGLDAHFGFGLYAGFELWLFDELAAHFELGLDANLEFVGDPGDMEC